MPNLNYELDIIQVITSERYKITSPKEKGRGYVLFLSIMEAHSRGCWRANTQFSPPAGLFFCPSPAPEIQRCLVSVPFYLRFFSVLRNQRNRLVASRPDPVSFALSPVVKARSPTNLTAVEVPVQTNLL